MRRSEVDALAGGSSPWIPALAAPVRDWSAAPGCRLGARYMVDAARLQLSRDAFQPFADRLRCEHWIVTHAADLRRRFPGAEVRPVRLDRWLLGLE